MHIKNCLFTVFLSLVLIKISFGQIFTKITPQNLVGVYNSHNAWIDFDNDGDLDFLITGESSTNNLKTLLYENVGNDNFRQALSPFNLPQYAESQIAFLNANGDDRIDLLLMGRRMGDSNTNRISVLENKTTGFADLGSVPDFGNPDGYGTICAGDVNNDGTSDIFISGINGFNGGSPSIAAFLYLNQNNAFIKSKSSNFTGVYLADSKLADLDNDRDLDIIISGNDGESPYQRTDIYLNDGIGNFTQVLSGLLKLQNTSIDIADYDGDNTLDVLLTGLDENLEKRTKLYKNTNGSFSEISLSSDLDRTANGSAKWGDFDNDGDLDFLITGQRGANPSKFAVYRNNTGNQFEEIVDTSFETLDNSFASWGDYDSDGDLDILVTGAKSVGSDILPQLYILKNGSTLKNNAPGKPSDVSVTMINSNACDFSWRESADDHTSSSSLTYNLSIREKFTGTYLLHPYSDNVTGRRSVIEQGNTWLNKSWKINNLKDGTYYVKVQAIDGGFSASEWSDEKTIYTGAPSTPGNLSATYVERKIKLTWVDNSSNEEFFVIERKVNNGTYQKFDSVISNTVGYNHPYEEFNMYEYRVYAVNPNQKSTYSNSVQTTIESPSSLSFSFFDGGLKLNWLDNSHNEKFFVIERKVEGGNYVKIDSVTSDNTSYVESIMDAGLYGYRIYAVNPNQKSGYSNSVQVVITGLEFDSPVGLYLYPNSGTDLITVKSENDKFSFVNIELISLSGVRILGNNLEFNSEGDVSSP